MTTATTTKTITVADLALAVNRLIAECPTQVNPAGDNSCLYYDDMTDRRCIVGQALYNLTGRNVHKGWEDNGIESLLDSPSFCEYFDLQSTGVDGADGALINRLACAQAEADGFIAWGDITPIRVDA